jgi:flagellar hook-length control protein FliK
LELGLNPGWMKTQYRNQQEGVASDHGVHDADESAGFSSVLGKFNPKDNKLWKQNEELKKSNRFSQSSQEVSSDTMDSLESGLAGVNPFIGSQLPTLYGLKNQDLSDSQTHSEHALGDLVHHNQTHINQNQLDDLDRLRLKFFMQDQPVFRGLTQGDRFLDQSLIDANHLGSGFSNQNFKKEFFTQGLSDLHNQKDLHKAHAIQGLSGLLGEDGSAGTAGLLGIGGVVGSQKFQNLAGLNSLTGSEGVLGSQDWKDSLADSLKDPLKSSSRDSLANSLKESQGLSGLDTFTGDQQGNLEAKKLQDSLLATLRSEDLTRRENLRNSSFVDGALDGEFSSSSPLENSLLLPGQQKVGNLSAMGGVFASNLLSEKKMEDLILQRSSEPQGKSSLFSQSHDQSDLESQEVSSLESPTGFFPMGSLVTQNLGTKAAFASSLSGSLLLKENENRIHDAAQVLVEKGGGSARIKLSPEGMGDLELKIRVQGDQVNVQFVTDNIETKELFEKSLKGLRAQLESQHLKIESLSIQVTDSQKGFSSDLNRDQSSSHQNLGLLRDMMNQSRQESFSRDTGSIADWESIRSYGRGKSSPDPIQSALEPRRFQRNYDLGNGRGQRLSVVG